MPGAAAPMATHVSQSTTVESHPLRYAPSICTLPAMRAITKSKGTATAPLMTAV
jgi:hypothetical protein